ncbi:Hypothetical protein F387_01190 [Wohlfahrtiimonas chitiniclastica SH04]|uniref:Uncharacterized protein n=1 Tax=Wohlfahrtiimonas chitiniclastica SH04 TaxID=1261130 RepID=L8Y0J6_9GAMM|nr:hypothetical protein [Wohlfahrtiimonas chitiniclastica]ELV08589.1 Hypothetical protein F387_01190 [Wohlfahrtiimonas chitiniclastica SH04]
MIYRNISFGYYSTMKATKPQKFIDWDALASLVGSPLNMAKDKAPLITPHNANGKTKDYANKAAYHIIVIDFDDVSYTVNEGIKKIEALYQGAFLYFTTASHLQAGKGNRFKVIIPINRPLNVEEYTSLSNGVALLFDSDLAQARPTQGFYAPNTLDRANYQGDLITGNGSHLNDDCELFKQAIRRYKQLINTQTEKAIKSLPKPHTYKGSNNGIIDLINQSYDIESLLQSNGYIKRGKCWLAPNSTSGMAGVHIIDGKRVYSHHSNDPLSAAKHDNHSLDVADVLCALHYHGDFSEMIKVEANNLDSEGQKARQKEYMQKQKTNTPDAAYTTTAANEIVYKALSILKASLNINLNNDELIAKAGINLAAIDGMINNTLRMTNNTKCFFLLTKDGTLNNHVKSSALNHMQHLHGRLFDDEKLSLFIQEHGHQEQAKEIKDEFKKALQSHIYFHIEHYNQRMEIHHSSDIFAEQSIINFTKTAAILTYAHSPLSFNGAIQYDNDVIEDYKAHFPEFLDVLSFIIDARFAPDRKNAYLWLHMPSNWGKSFFKGILNNLNIGVEVNESEIKNAFKGNPVGLQPTNFIGKFAMIFEEFKSVNSEMKQLENTLSLAPKGLPTCKVDIYAKLFFSAETVGSLMGSAGIEDQFANRFSYINRSAANDISNALDDRALFKELGSYEYMKHITSYTMEYFNRRIDEYKAMGKDAAHSHAIEQLNKFHDKYAIDKYAQRLSKELPKISSEFLAYLYAHDDRTLHCNDGYYLQRPAKRLEEWIDEAYDMHESRTLKHKKNTLLGLISKDGTGKAKPINTPEGKIRALPLRKMRA